ncbi:unnamed protein product [Pseudo-nitzschia multistriata]|uniref:Uncharacterized protein n=1 Tax=Pseudo-nitzschia multistriata TaxID=183589 RepID=A0A448YY33_9STRA|nr:unnamed protein product [Pseudo-nitzschia multistriata]
MKSRQAPEDQIHGTHNNVPHDLVVDRFWPLDLLRFLQAVLSSTAIDQASVPRLDEGFDHVSARGDHQCRADPQRREQSALVHKDGDHPAAGIPQHKAAHQDPQLFFFLDLVRIDVTDVGHADGKVSEKETKDQVGDAKAPEGMPCEILDNVAGGADDGHPENRPLSSDLVADRSNEDAADRHSQETHHARELLPTHGMKYVAELNPNGAVVGKDSGSVPEHMMA